MTGWALFLDYLIVIALVGALRARTTSAAALRRRRARDNPWDVIVGVGRDRRRRRRSGSSGGRRSTRSASSSPRSTSSTQLVLVVLGFALVFSPDALTHGTSLGTARAGIDSRSRCRSRCSRTQGSRRSRTSPRRRGGPGVDLPRSLFVRDRDRVVTLYVAIAVVALSAFPGPDDAARRATWLRAPLVGVATEIGTRAAGAARRRAARSSSALSGALDPARRA